MTHQHDLEHRYYNYLYSKGYTSNQALHRALQWYLRYFTGFPRVLDLGCGNGEFLGILQAAGHEAVGVDIDPAMVAECRQQGYTAYEADVITWLPTQSGQYDAIFSSNVIEHLDAQTVAAVVSGAYQALRPGGLLLLGTPNPESAIVHLHEYWRDPTHVRLYSRQVLEFFLHNAGFIEVKSDVNRETEWEGLAPMLQALQITAPDDPARQPPPPQHHRVAALQPWPAPPGSGSSLRQRLSFRLLNLVFKKFMEPYLDLVRVDLEHHRQHIVQLTDQVAWYQHRFTDLQQQVDQQRQQLGNNLRFLYQAREVFVYGYRPKVV